MDGVVGECLQRQCSFSLELELTVITVCLHAERISTFKRNLKTELFDIA